VHPLRFEKCGLKAGIFRLKRSELEFKLPAASAASRFPALQWGGMDIGHAPCE
jgi:hypothetical protein